MVDLRYPLGSYRAIGALKSSANTIEVYVEDSSMIPQWTNYVKKCLPSNAKISSVNAVGNRDDVIDLCRNDQADDARKRIYIIDGDLDFLTGKSSPRLKYLHRIPYTNLESAALDGNAIADICAMSSGKTKSDELSDFENYFERQWGVPSVSIGIFFAINCIFNLGVKTCSCHVTNFSNLQNGLHNSDRSKIIKKLNEIRKLSRRKSGVTKQAKRVRKRALNLPYQKILSGKMMILPIVSCWSTYRGAKGIPPKMLLNLLIDKRRSIDPALKTKLRRIVGP